MPCSQELVRLVVEVQLLWCILILLAQLEGFDDFDEAFPIELLLCLIPLLKAHPLQLAHALPLGAATRVSRCCGRAAETVE